MEKIVSESKDGILKLVRDGKVAVLYSPGFGAGWSTWNRDYGSEKIGTQMIFHPELVKMVEEGRRDEITTEVVERILNVKDEDDYGVCVLGVKDLVVTWIPEGQQFRITEYDGSESIRFPQHDSWMIA